MPHTCHPLRELIEDALQDFLPLSRLESAARLNDAIHYAVFPGGKRMRPLLTLLGARIAGVPLDDALPAACAVEFLHTSSLIFDDLPSMDDAALRRGSATLHLVFGEDIALLAALALLNQAYALFGSNTCLLAEAVACIGSNGMIGGQALDLAGKTWPHFLQFAQPQNLILDAAHAGRGRHGCRGVAGGRGRSGQRRRRFRRSLPGL